MRPYLLGSNNNFQNRKTNTQNIYQESEVFSTQESKPETLCLVGSCLRPKFQLRSYPTIKGYSYSLTAKAFILPTPGLGQSDAWEALYSH